MTGLTVEKSQLKAARVAGLLYLGLIVSGMISLMYVPSTLIVWDDAAATVKNITDSELLFRVGIVSGLIAFTFFILVPLALYKLLKPVDKNHAALMVIFALVSVPISYANILNEFAVLSLLSGEDYLSTFEVDQIHAQVMLYLNFYHNGNLAAQIFWGLWLFPFGYLVYKSGFLPKFLGIMLMIGCFGYLIDFFGQFLFPSFGETVAPTIIGLPASIGEIGICLWLLIKGVNVQQRGSRAPASPRM